MMFGTISIKSTEWSKYLLWSSIIITVTMNDTYWTRIAFQKKHKNRSTSIKYNRSLISRMKSNNGKAIEHVGIELDTFCSSTIELLTFTFLQSNRNLWPMKFDFSSISFYLILKTAIWARHIVQVVCQSVAHTLI